jgi:hypothetical protein
MNRIQQIERYVKQTMGAVNAPDLRIAHDFKHVDQVRCFADLVEIEHLEPIREIP